VLLFCLYQQVVFADFFMSTNHGNGLFCAGDLPGGCFN